MEVQLFARKLLQKLLPKKLVFMLYLAISMTAVLMFMLVFAQVRDVPALVTSYRVERLVVKRFRKLIMAVLLWVSVRTRGNASLTHLTVAPWTPR